MAKIKICGLSRLCDIDAVNMAKPDYVGFVFAESRRQVIPMQADFLRRNMSRDIVSVGIFANEKIINIISLVETRTIEMIQLHGNESEEYIRKLKLITDKKIIKAVSVLNTGDAQKWEDSYADYLLLDNKTGGTGESFDWDLVGEVKKPFFLAGGLNIENVGAAIRKTNPFAVDISSGVETVGFKDGDKIISVISNIRRLQNK